MAKKPRRPSIDKPVTLPQRPSKKAQLEAAIGGKPVGGDALPRKKRAPQRRRVSPKVRKLIGALLDDPDLTLQKAGELAGYPAKNADKQASRALLSVSGQELFRREMAKRPKLHMSALAEKLEQGLDATQTKLFAHEGQIVDERELVDYGARHAYLSLATRLAGADPTNKIDVTTNGKEINQPRPLVVLPQLTTEQLLALLEVPEPADALPAESGPAIEPGLLKPESA